jgi:hypothetical protein
MVNRRKITNTNIFFSSYNLGWFVYSKNNLGQSNLKKQKRVLQIPMKVREVVS